MVARQGGHPLALAVAIRREGASMLDVFGLDRRAMAAAARELAEEVAQPQAEVATNDTTRRAALEDAGFRFDGTRSATVAGAEITLCRYIR
jgi:hypothetical protein